MERRASLVLAVLVQSTCQLHLGGNHFLRAEGLKLAPLYREEVSEFMDFDPEQNNFASSLFLIEVPVPAVEVAAIKPDLLDDNLGRKRDGLLIVTEGVIGKIAFDKTADGVMLDSFTAEKMESKVNADAGKTSQDSQVNRLKRDVGYVDNDSLGFAPRRIRGGRIRY